MLAFCFIGTKETDSTLNSLIEMLHVHVYWHMTSRRPMCIHKSTPQKLLSEMRRNSVGLLDKHISNFTVIDSTTECGEYWLHVLPTPAHSVTITFPDGVKKLLVEQP